MLTRHFLQQSAKQLGVEPKRISDGALRVLSAFEFPGNVRQLENVCHWLTVMAPAQVIDVNDLPPEVQGDGDHSVTVPDVVMAAQAVPSPVLEPEVLSVTPATTALDRLPVSVTHAASGVLPGQGSWEQLLQSEARQMLEQGKTDVWDALTRRFELSLIQTALASTRGRRIEAAQKLGIGRNTITRKIQELGMDD